MSPINSNLLIYTFWIPRGIIAQTLFEFKDQYKIIYISGDRGLRTLESQIVTLKPSYILGLGYYRRGVRSIRSERIFKNVYGRGKIDAKGKDTYSPNWNIEMEGIKEGWNAGKSNCNKYGYRTLQIIEDAELKDSKFAYFHVPPDFSKDLLKNILLGVFENTKV